MCSNRELRQISNDDIVRIAYDAKQILMGANSVSYAPIIENAIRLALQIVDAKLITNK